jgi:hypothetical protein
MSAAKVYFFLWKEKNQGGRQFLRGTAQVICVAIF